MTRLSQTFGRLFDILAALAALTLLAMVLLVTADIVLRNVANVGFPWANEVTEYALYITTLLTAPWLLRRGQHVRIDLVLTLVPARLAWLMEILADAIGFVVCAVMVRYGAIMVSESLRLNSITIKNLQSLAADFAVAVQSAAGLAPLPPEIRVRKEALLTIGVLLTNTSSTRSPVATGSGGASGVHATLLRDQI